MLLIKILNSLQIEEASALKVVMVSILLTGIFGVVLFHFFNFFEQFYISKFKKPAFVFNHLFKRKLEPYQLKILENEFEFYGLLSKKYQTYFEHRVATFIKNKKFVGRENLEITDQIKILIAATAVMLTFGFRDYLLSGLRQILIYPKAYYSNINDEYHKGEFNPMLKTLVLSWEDFMEGYAIGNDNLNLGMHEIAHAIHFNSIKLGDISAVLFKRSFTELSVFLQQNKAIKHKLIETKYFREYAFTNQYEFLSVLLESFFETPKEFKGHFPEVYGYVKQMLNFNYAKY